MVYSLSSLADKALGEYTNRNRQDGAMRLFHGSREGLFFETG